MKSRISGKFSSTCSRDTIQEIYSVTRRSRFAWKIKQENGYARIW
jgi:hypothetical protein